MKSRLCALVLCGVAIGALSGCSLADLLGRTEVITKTVNEAGEVIRQVKDMQSKGLGGLGLLEGVLLLAGTFLGVPAITAAGKVAGSFASRKVAERHIKKNGAGV